MSAYLLILILVGFIPFEDFLLKWVPGYSYWRYLSELAIYGAFFLVILKKMIKREKLAKTKLDIPFFIFLEVIAISLVLNHAISISSIIKIKAIIRYIFLFYLAVNIDLNHLKVKKIINVILIAGIIQLVIGFAQKFSGGYLDFILAPPISEETIAGFQKNFALLTLGREAGSIYGAAGDTITYAVFMNIVLALGLSKSYFDIKRKKINPKARKWLDLLFICLIYISIIFTYARAVALSAFITIFLYLQKLAGKTKIWGLGLMALGLIFVILPIAPIFMSLFSDLDLGDFWEKNVSAIENLTILFDQDFLLEHTKVQRLGVLLDVTPIILSHKPLFGYGPDHNQTVAAIRADGGTLLTYHWLPEYIVDAYWVGLLAYFGVIGVIIIVWLFWRLYQSANLIYLTSQHQVTKELALTVIFLVIITIFLTFFNNVLEFRIYSFYFWLLPGLMFNLYDRELNQKISEENLNEN